MSFQELSHQTLCSLGITAALYQSVKDKPVLVDGAPEPVFLAGNRDDGLVKMPFVTELTDRSLLSYVERPARQGLFSDV